MTIDLEKIRQYFRGDRFAANIGVVIDAVSETSVQCSMVLTENHRNAVGGVQGGAIFTLADFTFAVHCNLAMVSGEPVGATVGQSCAISYLKLTRGAKLLAASTCLSRGRAMSVYRIDVTDDLGAPIAQMTGNAFTIHN
ncbi:MAG: PaaI family thioesterase [Planctomycetota bacterium]|jgi:acyl-CoA thioesterase|nr:PaaI family thioesterase [Planctomycetota bacterium]